MKNNRLYIKYHEECFHIKKKLLSLFVRSIEKAKSIVRSKNNKRDNIEYATYMDDQGKEHKLI